jgi:hypothetical protein
MQSVQSIFTLFVLNNNFSARRIHFKVKKYSKMRLMDFLDPKKRKNKRIRLITSYTLMAVLVGLATAALLYKAFGYGIYEGHVVQNGFVFVSSQPVSGRIYLNGTLDGTTNARLQLKAGNYRLDVARPGYRTWSKQIHVRGGNVQRIDYPRLVPKILQPRRLISYTDSPNVISQSPDRRWLLVREPNFAASFDLYDLKDPKDVAGSVARITLPGGVMTPSIHKESLKVVAWADDNRHVLLKHTFGDQLEYILLDTQAPKKSLNVNQALGISGVRITLQNKKYNQYFVYNPTTLTLSVTSLSDGKLKLLARDIVAYSTYGNNTFVYVTTADAPEGKVYAVMDIGGSRYQLQELPKLHSDAYLLDLSRYKDSWFVAVGTNQGKRVAIYRDPQDQPEGKMKALAKLKIGRPNFLKFSADSRFIMAEHGKHFAVYDGRYDHQYAFALGRLDKPAMHAKWLDAAHIVYVSKGKEIMADFDGRNVQRLVASAPGKAYFGTGYIELYTFTHPKSAPHALVLSETPILTPEDQ